MYIQWQKNPKNPTTCSVVSKSAEHFIIYVPDKSCPVPQPGDFWEITSKKIIKRLGNQSKNNDWNVIYAVIGHKVDFPKPDFGSITFLNDLFQRKPKNMLYRDVILTTTKKALEEALKNKIEVRNFYLVKLNIHASFIFKGEKYEFDYEQEECRFYPHNQKLVNCGASNSSYPIIIKEV